MTEDKKMPVLNHLEELRSRLIKMIVVILIATVACYTFRHHIMDFLQAPIKDALKGQPLRFFSLMEPFVVHVKVAVYSGIFFSMPVILYQLWMFVAPGLLPKERKYLLPFILMGTVFFLFGAGLCYYVILPYGTRFLLNFDPSLESTINISGYLSFSIQMILVFGVVFQLPLILMLMGRIGLISSAWLVSKRRYAVVIFFIIGAVLTPTPDPLTMSMMAVPLILMYELSIVLIRVFGRREPKPASAGAPST